MLIWPAHSRMIDALAFSPDGRVLAVAGRHLACRLVDAADGRRLWSVSAACAFGLSVAFGRDRSVLCRNGGLAVCDLATGTERLRIAQWCQSFGQMPDGRTAFVAGGGAQDLVRRYDLESGEVTGETPLAEVGAINRVAASPDGRLVALVGCKRFYLMTAGGEVIGQAKERALSNGAFALAFAPDGRTLVFTAGPTLFVWDTAAGRETHRVRLESRYFMDAAFTPDGRRAITVSKEGVARVWDCATWACERSLAWDVGPLRAVAVSPDGTRAAVAGDTGRVVVWDLEV